MTRLTAAPIATLATAALLALSAPLATAAPVTYEIDPTHTFPSFEADHMGMSHWRGMFTKSAGTVMLDKAGQTGTVDVTVQTDSIDYGLPVMNDKARSNEILDAAKYPQARFHGTLEGWTDGKPTRVAGELTLHGVTKPMTLKIERFKCQAHPMFKRDWCGADAVGTFRRDDFGMPVGKEWGFEMDVTLRVMLEAVAKE